jgi:GH43 family beta-xylosidase
VIVRLEDIQIRDPFVLRDEGKWYLYGSTDKDIWRADAAGFDAYISTEPADQAPGEFSGPVPAFRPPRGFWSSKNFWAPEVYACRGEYYMFATFKPHETMNHGRRGTASLKAKSLPGPFVPWSAGPITPKDWECLDGTLHIDPQGMPWMVFCREWQQVGNGEIYAVPLTEDLREAAGEPRLLFRADEAPWVRPLKGRAPGSYVTDGPFLYAPKNGALNMLWSSFTGAGYALGLAVSQGGGVMGPWQHQETPLYCRDGGHGMVFHTADGRIHLAIHSPNNTPMERALFIGLIEGPGGILEASGPVAAALNNP